MDIQLYFATNRAHEGADRFKPKRYGKRFSSDGMENLRFGKVTFQADAARVNQLLAQAPNPQMGAGDGEALQSYFATRVKQTQRIDAYIENIPNTALNERSQSQVKLGSQAMFADLRTDMQLGRDLLVLIHGFNVSWEEAVATAAALEAVINRVDAELDADTRVQPVRVVLFSWPSDGMALPFVSYKNDRADARGTAGAFGRAMLKLRDHLHELGRQARQDDSRIAALRTQMSAEPRAEVERAVAQLDSTQLCAQKIHLLAHSMGNYVLQNALERVYEYSPGPTLPRLFDQIVMAAPDVDDNVLESGQPLDRLHQVAQSIMVLHNAHDTALRVSDYTKGNPDRLGQRGAAHPQGLHQKIYQVDCAPLVRGLTQHSYYTNGRVARDIRLALQGLTPQQRGLVSLGLAPSMWQHPAGATQ